MPHQAEELSTAPDGAPSLSPASHSLHTRSAFEPQPLISATRDESEATSTTPACYQTDTTVEPRGPSFVQPPVTAPPAELDQLTVRRAQAGDKRAQTVFLQRYVRPMHGLVRRSGAQGDVDDLTQELLHKLLLALPRFTHDGPATLTTWVFTIAHHWLLDEKKRRHLQLLPIDEAHQVADTRASPLHLAEQKQLGDALESAIATLPEAQRRVFVLAQVHQQPLDAVAQVEAVPVGTIKSRLHRARAALALALRPQWRDERETHALTR